MGGPDVVDLYGTLGVAADASHDEIAAAVKDQRKVWVLRQNAPSLERRQEAERMLAQIAQAERVLLDPRARAGFDQELRGQREAAKTPAGSAGVDWLAQAQEALERGDAGRAAWAAQEATRSSPQEPEAWALRGRAHLEVGKLEEATYELEQATNLDPDSPYRHYELGWVLQLRHHYGPALSQFAIASELAPEDPFYRVAMGRNFVAGGKAKMGVDLLEPLARAHPGDAWVQGSLAWALCEYGTDLWDRLPDGLRLPLSKDQAESSLAVWHHAQSLAFDDDELRQAISERMGKAEHALSKHWAMSNTTLVVLLVLSVIIALNFGNIPKTDGALGYLAFGGCIYGIALLGRKPHYQTNAKALGRG